MHWKTTSDVMHWKYIYADAIGNTENKSDNT